MHECSMDVEITEISTFSYNFTLNTKKLKDYIEYIIRKAVFFYKIRISCFILSMNYINALA